MRREAFKFWDLVRLILETLRYMPPDLNESSIHPLYDHTITSLCFCIHFIQFFVSITLTCGLCDIVYINITVTCRFYISFHLTNVCVVYLFLYVLKFGTSDLLVIMLFVLHCTDWVQFSYSCSYWSLFHTKDMRALSWWCDDMKTLSTSLALFDGNLPAIPFTKGQ